MPSLAESSAGEIGLWSSHRFAFDLPAVRKGSARGDKGVEGTGVSRLGVRASGEDTRVEVVAG